MVLNRKFLYVATLSVGLLLGGIAYILYAIYIQASYKVTLQNDSSLPVINIIFFDATGIRHPFDDVAPHSTKTERMQFVGEGEVAYLFKYDDMEYVGTLIDYTANGIGGEVVLRVDENGVVSTKPSNQ